MGGWAVEFLGQHAIKACIGGASDYWAHVSKHG